MNLKEAFRYQNFLDNLMMAAATTINEKDRALTTVKTHRKNKVNPDEEDFVETISTEEDFPSNDRIINFMVWLVGEKERLTNALNEAKRNLYADVDAEIEANKYRRTFYNAIKNMLGYRPGKRIEKGEGYKFNNEGVQSPYVYEIEVKESENYDREVARKVMRTMISEADKTSSKVDSIMTNTEVDYVPPYDVNEAFYDIMDDFYLDPVNQLGN